MPCRVYYNDLDPFASEWTRELIREGLLPQGHVDGGSILEVSPGDLEGYDQCHFFAGIGGWPLALQQAGWGDRPVWTGSCPCQPFSSAGRQEGLKDERHLWPAFFDLIKECRPPVVLGEQVATAVGRGWLDVVLADLEQEGYAAGAVVLGAHSVGGPHIRQRIYWWGDRDYGGLPDPAGAGLEGPAGEGLRDQACNVLDGERGGRQEEEADPRPPGDGADGGGGAAALPGFWEGWGWLLFRDGKRRPVEPSIFPLAYGVPNRVGLLRGAGNALCVPTARVFIEEYMGACIRV